MKFKITKHTTHSLAVKRNGLTCQNKTEAKQNSLRRRAPKSNAKQNEATWQMQKHASCNPNLNLRHFGRIYRAREELGRVREDFGVRGWIQGRIQGPGPRVGQGPGSRIQGPGPRVQGPGWIPRIREDLGVREDFL